MINKISKEEKNSMSENNEKISTKDVVNVEHAENVIIHVHESPKLNVIMVNFILGLVLMILEIVLCAFVVPFL